MNQRQTHRDQACQRNRKQLVLTTRRKNRINPQTNQGENKSQAPNRPIMEKTVRKNKHVMTIERASNKSIVA